MSWDSIWDTIFRQQEWGKYPGEELIRFIAKNFYSVERRQYVRILEVGCGPGANIWFCAREGFQVYGIDGSSTAIARCRARLDSEIDNWQGRIQTGDICSIDFPADYFDAVIDCEAICCNDITSSKLIYREAARVLKVGGKLFSKAFAVGSWGWGTGEKLGHNAFLCNEGPLKGEGYTRFTDRSEIPDLLGPAFNLLSIEKLSRTLSNGRDEIIEWIIEAEKL